jgi:hypothetical protein
MANSQNEYMPFVKIKHGNKLITTVLLSAFEIFDYRNILKLSLDNRRKQQQHNFVIIDLSEIVPYKIDDISRSLEILFRYQKYKNRHNKLLPNVYFYLQMVLKLADFFIIRDKNDDVAEIFDNWLGGSSARSFTSDFGKSLGSCDY